MSMIKSVRNKLVGLAIIVILIPTVLVGTVNYFVAKIEIDNIGRLSLKNGTLGLMEVIATLDEQVQQGSLTLEQAQERARIQIVGEKKQRIIKDPLITL